ncbi:MAG: hypothetical protein ACOX5J_04970 [Candidatus Hydrogenedentales bacterium]
MRQFINDVVLLEDGLAWTYRSGDALALSFLVSNYAEAPLADTSLACRIECGWTGPAGRFTGTIRAAPAGSR